MSRYRFERPNGPVVMRPTWSHLLFLHWSVDPAQLQHLLPEGLEVDTFDSKAYVGLVPFVMKKVRPHFVPHLGRFAHFYEDFAELNVRTYVVRDGIPGVWFFSLDAASSLAVITARMWFKLPYFKARMRFWRGRDHAYRYWSKRLWPSPTPATCRVDYTIADEPAPATDDSLEQFLVERYYLYSSKNGNLFRGQVHHSPYRLQKANVNLLRENCVTAAGISRPNIAPHAVYSPGVDVEVWGLTKC